MQNKFLIQHMEEKLTKDNNPYFSLKLLSEEKETFVSNVWNDMGVFEIIQMLEIGDLISIEYQPKEYKGEKQVNIELITDVVKNSDLTDEELSCFIRVSTVSKEKFMSLYKHEKFNSLISDPEIKNLLDKVLFNPVTETKDLAKKFWIAPAGKLHHHNYRGGLAEHVYNCLKLFFGYCRSSYFSEYQMPNTSLVIAGLILHDFLKIKEYEIDTLGNIERTKYSNLIGHIAGNIEFLTNVISNNNLKINPTTKQHLFHILLSHHGEIEYGSPIKPATLEAYLVHNIDATDGTVFKFVNSEHGEYNKLLRNTIYSSKEL